MQNSMARQQNSLQSNDDELVKVARANACWESSR